MAFQEGEGGVGDGVGSLEPRGKKLNAIDFAKTAHPKDLCQWIMALINRRRLAKIIREENEELWGPDTLED